MNKPLSERVQLDDARDVMTIDGVQFSGELLAFFTTATKPGYWFRFLGVENGKLIVQQKEGETP